MVDDFIERKHGRQDIVYELPQLEPILKDTYGIILYQEQVQKIAASLASFSLGAADLLRRAMGKKDIDEMARQKQRFLAGTGKNNIDEKVASDIFDLMAEFANYGFNKSHSAAYGLVSYQTAFLKTHHPEEFMAGIMTCDMGNTEKMVRYIEECKRMGIKVNYPDINSSLLEFNVPEPKVVDFGLAAIKGIGMGALEEIVCERLENGKYQNPTDLAKRVNLHKAGKKTCELLITSGGFDCFNYSRPELMAIVADLVKYSRTHHDAKSVGQMSLFDDFGGSDSSDEDEQIPWDQNLGKAQNLPSHKDLHWLMLEKKNLGTFISSHPLELFKMDIKRFSNGSFANLQNMAGKRNVGFVCFFAGGWERLTKNGSRMLSARFEDLSCSVEAISFDEDLMDNLPPADSLVFIEASIKRRFGTDEVSMSIDKITLLEEFRKRRVSEEKLIIHVPARQGANVSAAPVIAKIKELLKQNPGRTRVSLELNFEQADLMIGSDEYRISPTNTLLCSLRALNIENTDLRFTYQGRR
jgi:DNA polymerase-3 subunit alpha